MEPEQKHCPACGATVSADALVCSQCAADLSTPSAAPPLPTWILPPPGSLEIAPPEPEPPQLVPEEPLVPDKPPGLEPAAPSWLPEHGVLPGLGGVLPPGTLSLDLDQVAAATLNRPPSVDLTADVAEALALQLPSGQQDAAPALASYLLVTLEAQTRMTGRSVLEELQELARGQSTLEVEVSQEGGKRHTEMRINTRHTMGTSPGGLPLPPTWTPPPAPSRPGCRITCCAPTALALLALLLGLIVSLWR